MSRDETGLFAREMKYLDAERAQLVAKESLCILVDEMAARFPDSFVSAHAGYLVTASFNMNAVRDMVPILRWWSGKGYRQATKPNVGSFIVWKLGTASMGHLNLVAYFNENGSCRKVKVGETAQMVPVYEIQCGGKPVNDIVDQLKEVDAKQ